MDEFDLASRSYEELLTRWPADTRYRGNLAQAYLQGGEIDKGVATAVQAATDNSKSAVVRSNLPMALLIGGALNDAQRDGLRTLADLPHPLPLAYVAVAAADALLGKRDAALELQGRLVAIDPSVAAASRADFALFEGRITDAIALLEAGIADDTAKKATAAAEAKWATLAEAELRREHLAAARQAAAHAVGSRELVTMMRVARVLARAGSPDSELDGRIRAHPGQRAEVFARIVAIDDRRSKADVDPLDVGHGSGSWLLYADRGARLFKDGAWDGARRAFEECLSHLGQGAMAFVDDTATLRYIPEVRFLHARTLDALHDPGAAAAYKAFLDSEPDAQGDPMVTAAKLRAASL
jgi:tetratricopeptide (TPR) repeat protein